MSFHTAWVICVGRVPFQDVSVDLGSVARGEIGRNSEPGADDLATKVKHAVKSTGQREIFQSLHDMGPDDMTAFLESERVNAEKVLLALTPDEPASIPYQKLWPQVLARHVVRKPDVNKIAARLRDENSLIFLDWEKGKRVPQPHYKTQRPR